MSWLDDYAENRRKHGFKRPLKVFYGYAKLTPKIVRKKQLIVFFENGDNWNPRKEKYLKQKMKIVYHRNQTPEELESAYSSTQEFTRYGVFIDEKPYKGNIELVLEQNFLADANHMPEDERNELRKILREAYFDFYKVSPEPKGQQAIIFY